MFRIAVEVLYITAYYFIQSSLKISYNKILKLSRLVQNVSAVFKNGACSAAVAVLRTRVVYKHVYWLASDAITDAFVGVYGSFYVLKTPK